MYYLRRFVAQGIDAVLILLIGTILFYGFSHSPVDHSEGKSVDCSEEKWTFSPSPMHPNRTGLEFACTFPKGEEVVREVRKAKPVKPSQRIRLLHGEWGKGVGSM